MIKNINNNNNNNNMSLLDYYTGDIALGCDPSPEGSWEKGIFTARDGSRWAVQDDDCHYPGNDTIYLTPAH